jgi:hypothetical protein
MTFTGNSRPPPTVLDSAASLASPGVQPSPARFSHHYLACACAYPYYSAEFESANGYKLHAQINTRSTASVFDAPSYVLYSIFLKHPAASRPRPLWAYFPLS